jgi:hypothetical protein
MRERTLTVSLLLLVSISDCMTPTNPYETEARRHGRWPVALFGGLAAAVVGAIAWAAVTVTAKYQIGWMAVGVGLLVGLTVRLARGGKTFAILGACLALFGCVLGNFLSLVAFNATEQHLTLLTALRDVDFATTMSALWDDFLSTSILFYAIAVYEGYKFSQSQGTLADQEDHSSVNPISGTVQRKTSIEREQS